MKILKLDLNPLGINRASVRVIVEGQIDYNLPNEILGKDYELKVLPIRKKRTLTANAYYWSLLEKLAQVMRLPQKEVHEKMLRDYGRTCEDSEGKPIMLMLRANINPSILNTYTDIVKCVNIKGEEYIVYRVVKGSSEMDPKEFSALLDGLVYDCKEQGIETMTPSELEQLKGYERWIAS